MMNDSMDLILYENLRKRIINNEELSDKEWDLFFYIEEKTKGIRIKNNEWSKIFSAYSSDTILKPEERQQLEELKEEYILKNADDIIDRSIEKTINKSQETTKEKVVDNFLNNRQLIFAISTGVVILVTTIFLFSNRNKLYTGDHVDNRKTIYELSADQSNDLVIKEKPEDKFYSQNDKPTSAKDNEDLNKSNSSRNQNFAVNSFMEENVSTNFRDSNNYIKLDQPLPSAEFTDKTFNSIAFKGLLFSKRGEITSIVLKIFDNKEANYINDNPVVKKQISFEQTNNEQKTFDIVIASKLKSGLYYYTFEDEEGNLLTAGKFVVKI